MDEKVRTMFAFDSLFRQERQVLRYLQEYAPIVTGVDFDGACNLICCGIYPSYEEHMNPHAKEAVVDDMKKVIICLCERGLVTSKYEVSLEGKIVHRISLIKNWFDLL